MSDIPDNFIKIAKVQNNLLASVASISPIMSEFNFSPIASLHNQLQPVVSSTAYLAEIYDDINQIMQPVIPSTSFFNPETVHALSSIGNSRLAIASMIDISSYTNMIDQSALSEINKLNENIQKMTEGLNLTVINRMNYPNIELHSELVKIAASPVAHLNDYLASVNLPSFESIISELPITDIAEKYDDTVNPLPTNIEIVTYPHSNETEQSNDSPKTHNHYESENETSQNKSSFLNDPDFYKQIVVSWIITDFLLEPISKYALNQITQIQLNKIIGLVIEFIDTFLN